MRKVCRLAREVLDVAAAMVKPGVTTDQIDEIVHNACIERNVSSLPPYTYLPNTVNSLDLLDPKENCKN